MEALKINFFPVFFLAALAFPLFSQNAGDFAVTQNKSGDVVITGYRGNAKDLTIPPAINGIPVAAIGRAAFRNR